MRVEEIRLGGKVLANGYPGTVRRIHTDRARLGMVDVRLERGTVTVDADDLEPA